LLTLLSAHLGIGRGLGGGLGLLRVAQQRGGVAVTGNLAAAFRERFDRLVVILHRHGIPAGLDGALIRRQALLLVGFGALLLLGHALLPLGFGTFLFLGLPFLDIGAGQPVLGLLQTAYDGVGVEQLVGFLVLR